MGSDLRKVCKGCVFWTTFTFWLLYIIRICVFITFNVYRGHFYKFWFYLIEISRFGLWGLIFIYLWWP